jgi:recombination protein RecR
MRYPDHLLKLIDVLRKLPGVGNKSAERFAFHLLNSKVNDLNEMAKVISQVPEKLKLCETCGCLIGIKECSFCDTSRYSTASLCIIASAKDAYAIDDTGEFKGLYHVLGDLLSPMHGIGPEKLKIENLKNRIVKHNIQEIVIALDSTLEGDATSLYLKEELKHLNINISRLAFGLPMGSSLDYVDGGTLARAFMGRGIF